MNVNRNKMSIVGEFIINGNNLIIDGLMKLNYFGEEETAEMNHPDASVGVSSSYLL